MALTLTTLDAAVVLTTAGLSNGTKTTLGAATTAFRLHASILNGAKAGNPQQQVKLRYAISTFDMTTAQAMDRLQRDAETLDLLPPANPAETKIRSTDLNDAFGSYLYTWLESGVFSPGVTVTVTLVEG